MVDREIALAEKNITDLRKERDALLFNKVAEGDAARTSVEARLTAAAARLDFLRTLVPSGIEIAAEKPVVIKEGTGAGKLLATPAVPPEIYCAQQGIDLLIGGTIQEVQGYLLLDVWAFDPLRGKKVFTSRNAATRDELYASLPGFGREIARNGSRTALVARLIRPRSARHDLYVDASRWPLPVPPRPVPGSRARTRSRLSAAGYREVTRSIDAGAGERRPASMTPWRRSSKGGSRSPRIPPGADLYVDSLWQGKTPLEVDRPPLRSRGVLSSAGFYDMSFSLEPASPPELSFSLQKDVGRRDIQQKKARDEFYSSLGFFALSLPLPLFSYALSIDFAVTHTST